MEIKLSENLQKFRIAKGCTQSELASALHVTPQAVSKWERAESLPDIMLLPKLACFLGVTTDKLLGTEESAKKEEISCYKKQAIKLHNKGKIREAADLWRKALEEFPDEIECLNGLMGSLHFIADEEKTDEEREETILLAEKILGISTDETFRRNATQILIYDLPYAGRTDEAEKLAKSAPPMFLSSEVFSDYIFKIKGDRERGRENCIDTVFTILELANNLFYDLCVFNKGNYELYIKIHEAYIRMCDAVFDDGQYGFFNCFLMTRHYWLAKLYTCLYSDEQKARYHLKAAADCAIAFDSLPEKFIHRSSIFGEGYEYDISRTSRNSDKSVAYDLRYRLDGKGLDLDGGGLDVNEFDCWREKEWFKEIVTYLENNL